MWLGNRLERMEAARPAHARLPHELARDNSQLDAEDIEGVQLEAFEAGEAEWWLAMPARGEGGDAQLPFMSEEV